MKKNEKMSEEQKCRIFTGGVLMLVLFIILLTGIQELDHQEQLVVQDSDGNYVVNGPQTTYCLWCTSERRNAIVLTSSTYFTVHHLMTGAKRLQKGPGLFWLEADEHEMEEHTAPLLAEDEYLWAKDSKTALSELVMGPQRFFPEPHQTLGEVEKATRLEAGQYVVTTSIMGQLNVVEGPGIVFPVSVDDESGKSVRAQLGAVKEGTVLTKAEYAEVKNQLTGAVTIVKGPKRVVPQVNEAVKVNDAKMVTEETALLVVNSDTGVIRLVTSPMGLYFPEPFEEVKEERSLIRITDYETMVVANEDGVLTYKSGIPTTQSPNGGLAFFLPAMSTIEQFKWTKGGNVEFHEKDNYIDVTGLERKDTITKIDSRRRQMAFEFNDVRTKDNMEFEMEGRIFWQVTDVKKLVQYTGDPTGDIWHRVRAQISQGASQFEYATFLSGAKQMFEDILNREITEHADFYTSRGIDLHHVELIEMELANEALEESMVDAVGKEAAERINRLQQQESEAILATRAADALFERQKKDQENVQTIAQLRSDNDLQEEENKAKREMKAEENKATLQAAVKANGHADSMLQMQNDLLVEKERQTLLAEQAQTSSSRAEMEGVATGTRLGSAIDKYLQVLETKLPELPDRVELYKLHQALESKDKTTANLAGGNAQLYMTPEDANINLGASLAFAGLPDAAEADNGGRRLGDLLEL